MRKTADRYCEGGIKTLQTKASGSLVTKLFHVSSFFVTNKQKNLENIHQNLHKSLQFSKNRTVFQKSREALKIPKKSGFLQLDLQDSLCFNDGASFC